MKKKILEIILVAIGIIIFAYILYNFPFITAIIILLLFTGFLLIFDRKLAIAFILFSLPILYYSLMILFKMDSGLFYYFWFFLLILYFIYNNIVQGDKIPFSISWFHIIILSFLVYAVFSTFFISQEKGYGFEKITFWCTSLFICYILISNSKDEKDLEKYLLGMTYFGGFFVLLSLLSYHHSTHNLNPAYGGRFTILNINPIWAARYLSYSILADLYFIKKYWYNVNQNLLKILMLFILLILQMGFLLLTGSRGPLFGLILALSIISILKYKINFVKLTAFCVCIILLLTIAFWLLPENIVARLTSSNKEGQTTFSIRVLLNDQALRIFLQNKLFGIGFGGFMKVNPFKYPHNIFTEVLCELGIVGFILLNIIFGYTVKMLWTLRKKLTQDMFYVLTGFFAAAFMNSNLSGHIGINNYLWISIGLIYTAYYITFKQEKGKLQKGSLESDVI